MMVKETIVSVSHLNVDWMLQLFDVPSHHLGYLSIKDQEPVRLEESKRKSGWARTDFDDFAGYTHSIDQKSGEIWTGQALLRPITFKSDRLLVFRYLTAPDNVRLRATLNAEWPLQKPVLIYTQI